MQEAVDVTKACFTSICVDSLAFRGWTQAHLHSDTRTPFSLTEQSWPRMATSVARISAYLVTDYAAVVVYNSERRAILLPETYSVSLGVVIQLSYSDP